MGRLKELALQGSNTYSLEDMAGMAEESRKLERATLKPCEY